MDVNILRKLHFNIDIHTVQKFLVNINIQNSLIDINIFKNYLIDNDIDINIFEYELN